MALACPLTATATTREYTGKPYSPCAQATPSTSKYFTRSPPFSCTPPIPFISSSAVRSGLRVLGSRSCRCSGWRELTSWENPSAGGLGETPLGLLLSIDSLYLG